MTIIGRVVEAGWVGGGGGETVKDDFSTLSQGNKTGSQNIGTCVTIKQHTVDTKHEFGFAFS